MAGSRISLQPGNSDGGAGTAGAAGNILLAPSGGGRVGGGTNNPQYRLHLEGGAGTAVYGNTTGFAGAGVSAHSTTGDGVDGHSTKGSGVYGSRDSGYGIFSFSLTGYASYFDGKTRVQGNLLVDSCTGCTTAPSDSALKANFSAVDPRSILDKLAAISIKEWNYKLDSPSATPSIVLGAPAAIPVDTSRAGSAEVSVSWLRSLTSEAMPMLKTVDVSQ